MSTRPSQVEEKRRESSYARYQSTFTRKSSITLAISNLTDRHFTLSVLLTISFLCLSNSLSLSLGVSHGAFESDITALKAMRELYEYLPLNNRESPPVKPTEDCKNRADESLRCVVDKY